jgi:hypothetical protein
MSMDLENKITSAVARRMHDGIENIRKHVTDSIKLVPLPPLPSASNSPPVDGDAPASAALQKLATELEERITDRVAKRIDDGIELVRKHVTDSISSIAAPPLRPAPNAVLTYRDALGKADPVAPNTTQSHIYDADPKRRARDLSKAKQILIDFTELREREKMRSTSLTALVEGANEALSAAFPDSTANFINAQKLAHGGLLLEFSSIEAVALLSNQQACDTFLAKLGASATIRARQFNTSFRSPSKPATMRV